MGLWRAFKGILKKTGSFYCDVFGITDLKKSKEGQDLQDSANDLTEAMGLGRIFDTDKEKAKRREADERATRRAIQDQARTSQEIAEELRKINDYLNRHP